MPLTTSTPFCSILLHSILLTRLRFAIQRCAARALTQPSFRQLSTLRQTTRVTTPFPAAQPSLLRTFHQSRLWLAPEGKTDEARATDETIPTEHEADVEPDTLTEKVKDYASSAAETLSNAAASTTAAASSIASAAVGRRVGEWPGDSGTGAGPKRIIYVGNLFFETTIEEVEAEFAQYGQISKSRLVADARGMSKGFAYVEFAEPEAAEQAVQRSDQKTLNGRRMAVQYHVRNEKRTRNVGVGGSSEARNPPSKTLFIGNMSYQMSDRDLNGESGATFGLQIVY